MSAADEAYKAAVAEIESAIKHQRKTLDLSGKWLPSLERVPNEIASATQLRRLDLWGTKITDIADLKGLTNLNYLGLWDTPITNIAALSGLKGLQRLELGGTNVSSAELAHLAGILGLQHLDLENTKIDDSGLKHLAGLVGLQVLDLSGTHIGDAGLINIGSLRALQGLDLIKTKISDEGLAHLAGMTQLQRLDLVGTQVLDLRMICHLPFNEIGNALSDNSGIHFSNTPAARSNATLKELANIRRDGERTEKTLAYLRSLPKYPAPLPWLQQDNLKPQEVPAPAPQARQEPPLTRGQVKVKTSAAQIKLLLREPQMTRITAQGIAAQIRAAMEHVQPVSGNALPAALQTILEIADSLDGLGQTDLSPKAKAREEDLRLRIAHLEAVVQKLTLDLKDSHAARDAAQALANKDDAWKVYKKTIAAGAAVATVYFVTAGVYSGLSTFLGNTHPYVLALKEGFGVLNK